MTRPQHRSPDTSTCGPRADTPTVPPDATRKQSRMNPKPWLLQRAVASSALTAGTHRVGVATIVGFPREFCPVPVTLSTAPRTAAAPGLGSVERQTESQSSRQRPCADAHAGPHLSPPRVQGRLRLCKTGPPRPAHAHWHSRRKCFSSKAISKWPLISFNRSNSVRLRSWMPVAMMSAPGPAWKENTECSEPRPPSTPRPPRGPPRAPRLAGQGSEPPGPPPEPRRRARGRPCRKPAPVPRRHRPAGGVSDGTSEARHKAERSRKRDPSPLAVTGRP